MQINPMIAYPNGWITFNGLLIDAGVYKIGEYGDFCGPNCNFQTFAENKIGPCIANQGIQLKNINPLVVSSAGL